MRNPKDVITSFFHFHQLFRVCEFKGDMELFAQYFMDDKRIEFEFNISNGKSTLNLIIWLIYFSVMFSPYFRHVLELSQNTCREISHDLAFVEQFLDCYRGKTAGGKVCTLSTRLCS